MEKEQEKLRQEIEKEIEIGTQVIQGLESCFTTMK
jgi:hypothetical protein